MSKTKFFHRLKCYPKQYLLIWIQLWHILRDRIGRKSVFHFVLWVSRSWKVVVVFGLRWLARWRNWAYCWDHFMVPILRFLRTYLFQDLYLDLRPKVRYPEGTYYHHRSIICPYRWFQKRILDHNWAPVYFPNDLSRTLTWCHTSPFSKGNHLEGTCHSWHKLLRNQCRKACQASEEVCPNRYFQHIASRWCFKDQ